MGKVDAFPVLKVGHPVSYSCVRVICLDLYV